MRTIQSEKGEIKLPCLDVIIVDIDLVQANNYNPNNVAENNMKLLYGMTSKLIQNIKIIK